jgi:hypothetical protein
VPVTSPFSIILLSFVHIAPGAVEGGRMSVDQIELPALEAFPAPQTDRVDRAGVRESRAGRRRAHHGKSGGWQRAWSLSWMTQSHRAPASTAPFHMAGFAPGVSHPMIEPCFIASICSGVGGCARRAFKQAGEHRVSAGCHPASPRRISTVSPVSGWRM